MPSAISLAAHRRPDDTAVSAGVVGIIPVIEPGECEVEAARSPLARTVRCLGQRDIALALG